MSGHPYLQPSHLHKLDNSSGRGVDRRVAEMDELGSEVFTLKLAMQAYEDRLAELYQTEDRSKWRGPATLLVDLKAADQEVDRLENTVASLRHQLRDSQSGGSGSGGGGRSDGSRSSSSSSSSNSSSSNSRGNGSRGGFGSSSNGGGDDRRGGGDGDRESEYALSVTSSREDQQQANEAELREQIARLEEDNRALAGIAGWELCDLSEGEEEDALLVPTGPSKRIRAIHTLAARIKELTALLKLAMVREKDARAVAEDACARMDDAVARTDELEAEVMLYKRAKAEAEERESALKDLLDAIETRRTEERDGADGGSRQGHGQEQGQGQGQGRANDGAEEADPPVPEKKKASTRAAGTNTEKRWPVDPDGGKIERLEADARRWREKCERSDTQLQKEKSLGEETARRLCEKEAMVEDLAAKLQEVEATATSAATDAPGKRSHSPTSVPDAHARADDHGSESSSSISDSGSGGGSDIGEQGSGMELALGTAADTAAAAAADSSVGSSAITMTSTEEEGDATWKGQARASADTQKDVSPTATPTAGGDEGTTKHCRAASSSSLAGCEEEKGGSEDAHVPGASRKKQAAGGEANLNLGSGLRESSGAGRPATDELSTAECSAETTESGGGGASACGGGGGGGGGDSAVGVSFDVGSSGEEDNEHEAVGKNLEAKAADGVETSQSQIQRQQRQGWKHWQQQQQHGSDGRLEGKGISDGAGSEQSPTVRVAAGDEIVPAEDGQDERVMAAARRAENAAVRAEASAQRAERSAAITRAERAAAETAAAAAHAAAPAAMVSTNKTPTAKAIAAPMHGSFGGEVVPRPQAVAMSRLPPQSPVGSGGGGGGGGGDVAEGIINASTQQRADEGAGGSNKRTSRQAKRASMVARLEMLAASTEAERAGRASSVSFTSNIGSSNCSEDGRDIHASWSARIETVDTIVATLKSKGDSSRRGLRGDGLEEEAGDGTTAGSLGHESASESLSTSGRVRRVSKTVAGGRTQDVEYWNRPATMAAAAAARSSQSAPKRRRSASAGEKPKPPAVAFHDEASGVVENDRHAGAAAGQGGASTDGDGGIRPKARGGAATDSPFGSSSSPFGGVEGRIPETVGGFQPVGGYKSDLAVAAAAADAMAATREAQRRRRWVLEHVEPGRGGQGHYSGEVKRRSSTRPTRDGEVRPHDDATNSSDAGGGSWSRHDDGVGAADDLVPGEELLSPGQRWSGSSTITPSGSVFHQQGAPTMLSGAGMADTGVVAMAAGDIARQKKRTIKKKKGKRAGGSGVHASVPLHRRQIGHVHANGTFCARSCACSTCVCFRPVSAPILTAGWRRREPIGAWR